MDSPLPRISQDYSLSSSGARALPLLSPQLSLRFVRFRSATMNVYLPLSLSAVYLLSVLQDAAGVTCSMERRKGITEYFTCPGLLDRPSARFCCGSKKQRYCCDLDDFSDTVKSVGAVIGVIIAVVIGLVVVVIIACFCCSCCLLAKRRQNRGQVLYGGATTTTPASRPEEQLLGAAPYPQQPQLYPQQPYPQQTYPPQSYPSQPQPYATAGYPVQPPTSAPGFAPYPTSYPPPYSDVQPEQQALQQQQQPAYNPSYPPH